ncbi:MAG: FtsX-like permease family protein [Planctomycetaceae bacterium]
MTRTRFLLETLTWHWRSNLAVLLGVAVGAAVLSGALIVGDSVRGSLRDMTLVRLGRIDHALHGPRFVREQLADDLAALPAFQSRFDGVAPAIILPAVLEKPTDEGAGAASRAGHVRVYGVDARAWQLLDHGPESPPENDEVILSAGLARELSVRPGDAITISLELPSDVPRDALLGKRDDTSVQAPLTVRTVLAERAAVGRLGLEPDQQAPRNAFVSLGTLQDRLGLAARRATRRDPQPAPARVNALLVAAQTAVPEAASAGAAEELTHRLGDAWRLSDLHLRIVTRADRGYIALESERMILEPAVARAAQATAQALQAATSPVLVYIANEMSVAGRPVAGDPRAQPPGYSRYSVVAGLDPATFADPSAPFGPFTFDAPIPSAPLDQGDLDEPDGTGAILLNDWLAADLDAGVGDVIRLTYHLVGSHGELPEVERRFVVRGIVKLAEAAADRGLTPEVRGITDVDSFDDWDAPFPMKTVTKRDDAYWQRYRATPKAFVTLDTARRLWSSRYGDLTSIRIAPAPGQTLESLERDFSSALLHNLGPAGVGLAFQPVKQQGLQAAAGTTDFGGLFLGFSLFLILSAMILIGLLFRLGIERRGSQVGLLLAIGFSHAQVRLLLLLESLLVVAAGALLGLLAAVAYASLIVHGLKTWWIGAIGTRFLSVHVLPGSLAIGAAIAVIIGLAAVWWGMRSIWRVSPRGLLAGETTVPLSDANRAQRRRRALRVAQSAAGLGVLATLLVALRVVPAAEAFAGFNWPTIVFFLTGLSLLAAGLAALAARLDSDRSTLVSGSGFSGLSRLGARNAARNRNRSLLSAGLIACATFLIVAIAAGHRNPAGEAPEKNSGNGGFTLVAESAVPVVYDLNSPAGRAKLGLDDDEATRRLQAVRQVVAFAVNPGENASCLNIYQTTQPTVLGVPQEMLDRGGFRFVGADRDNPWNVLSEVDANGAIPVLGDMNTLQYSLHVGPGATLEIRDEFQQPVKVRIAGMLDGSVFQGVLLMGEKHFQRLFPSRAGARYFLIDVPPADARQVADLLESKLPGFDAEHVVDRLAGFLAVQNTYLSTFQALGGLGLVLGTIGLATVMLRNVIERRAELALLRAVGFRESGLAWLVLCENSLLLAWGVFSGTVAALVAMLPHLVSTEANVPWWSVALLLATVFVVGTAAALAAVRGAIRTPVVATLRAG